MKQILPSIRIPTAAARALVAVCALVGTSAAQLAEAEDPKLAPAKITEHLGDFVPLGLVFTDEDAKPVKLRALWNQDRPVLLT